MANGEIKIFVFDLSGNNLTHSLSSRSNVACPVKIENLSCANVFAVCKNELYEDSARCLVKLYVPSLVLLQDGTGEKCSLIISNLELRVFDTVEGATTEVPK